MDYRTGLLALKNFLPEEAHYEFFVHEAKLIENVSDETKHGSTEQLRSDRSKILEQLNQLAVRYRITSFNALCQIDQESITDDLRIGILNEPIYSKHNRLLQHEKNLNKILHHTVEYGSSVPLTIHKEFQHEKLCIEQLKNSIRDELIHKRSNFKTISNDFIGREKQQKEILSALNESNKYQIIAIDGLGGIGKTALAHKVVEISLNDNIFYSVTWDSAKPSEFTGIDIHPQFNADIDFDNLLDSIGNQLGHTDVSNQKSTQGKRKIVQDILNSDRYIVVIDNLETVEGYEKLLNDIRGMFTRSKAILTTRKKIDNFFHVCSFSLRGLEQPESIEFLKSFASSRGESADIIRFADEEQLIQIHKNTGGLPLAMQLVVGQATRSSKLGIIIEKLNKVNFHQLEKPESDEDVYNKFYKFIYWDSWNQLSEQARKVLIRIGCFSLSKGADFEELEFTSKLKEIELDQAIGELIENSLIYRNINRDNRDNNSFYLHPLTYRFVQDELVRG